ncbi:tyrosine-type recombinase/integrase [Vibrio cyclitrophicus]|uniref:tyrosine-type recombinase/integrase n=1 Tax=Vibrio cyclitrophicus TaxID=47951 RepID=UPI00399B7CA2
MKIVENQASSPMSSKCVQESISVDNEIRKRNQVTDHLINDAVGEVIFSNVSPLVHCIELFKSEPKWLNAQRSRALLKQTPDYCQLEIIDAIFPYDATPSHLAEKTLKKLKRLMGADKSRVLIFEEIRTNLTAFYCLLRDAQAFVESLDLDEAERCLVDIQALREIRHPNLQTFAVGSLASQTVSHTDAKVDDKASAKETSREIVNINEVCKAYRLEKLNKKRDMANVDAYIKSCENVHELLGSLNMAQITRDDVNLIIPDVKVIPKNINKGENKTYFSGMNLKEAIEENKKLNRPIRKEKQAIKDIERCSTIYKWAIEHNKITYNPFSGLSGSKSSPLRVVSEDGNIPSEQSDKKPFDTAELKEIFSHPVYTAGKIGRFNKIRLCYQYWVMLIALVTGARGGEICQMRVIDVRSIDSVKCFIIHEGDVLQSVKNTNSVRYVPIPEKLFELGFEEYFDSVKDGEWLFPDLTYTEKSKFYGKVEDWFTNHFTKKMKLTEKDKAFSSLRHNFIDYFKGRGERCSHVARLVGHGNHNITDDVYGGRISAKTLKVKIDEYDVSDILENVLPFKVEV